MDVAEQARITSKRVAREGKPSAKRTKPLGALVA